MSRTTFMLIAIGYYIISMVVIGVVLFLINHKIRKKYLAQIAELEREKNLIISASILTELNKVEALINNDDLRAQYDGWKERFNNIKEKDMPKITDMLNDVQLHYDEGDFKLLRDGLTNTELELNYLKTKSDFLLSEIREITLSEQKNREKITLLKAEYRAVVTEYNENIEDFAKVQKPIELQFENVDKLFANFENAMDKNAYTEVGKIVKAIDGIVSNLKIVIKETKTIVQYGEILIPKKIEDISRIAKALTNDGYNIEYLNIDYNINETNKKIASIFQRLNMLDVEDSVFELKTMLDYYDSLYSDFDKEKLGRRLFEEYSKSILIKHAKLERNSNLLYSKIDEIKYSYDLNDEDIAVIIDIKDELMDINNSYESVMNMYRNKTLAYSKLSREMEAINVKLANTEKKLIQTIRSIEKLNDDEKRAHSQLVEIKNILAESKDLLYSYKLPVVPKKYYIELAEATDAVDLMVKELEKKPISISLLNMRVENASDLVSKVFHTIKTTTNEAKRAEMAIVYGNRYRTVNHDVDFGLTKAEDAFAKGNYRLSFDQAIRTIDIVEKGISQKLLDQYKD